MKLLSLQFTAESTRPCWSLRERALPEILRLCDLDEAAPGTRGPGPQAQHLLDVNVADVVPPRVKSASPPHEAKTPAEPAGADVHRHAELQPPAFLPGYPIFTATSETNVGSTDLADRDKKASAAVLAKPKLPVINLRARSSGVGLAAIDSKAWGGDCLSGSQRPSGIKLNDWRLSLPSVSAANSYVSQSGMLP